MAALDNAPIHDIDTAGEFQFEEKKQRGPIRKVIDDVLKGKSYEDDKVSQWVNEICENALHTLYNQEPKKPYKYIVTCVIMQRTGAALHSAAAAYWDVSDVVMKVTWPKKPKSAARDTSSTPIVCIVTVGAVSFYPS